MKRKAAAFNLIELMVVMGVAAVLIILGLYGARLIQQRSRDSYRKSVLAEMVNAINAYRIVNLNLPDNDDVVFSADGFYINGVRELELSSYRSAADSTTNSQTKYYYTLVSQSYAICTELESGSIENSGPENCPEPLP